MPAVEVRIHAAGMTGRSIMCGDVRPFAAVEGGKPPAPIRVLALDLDDAEPDVGGGDTHAGLSLMSRPPRAVLLSGEAEAIIHAARGRFELVVMTACGPDGVRSLLVARGIRAEVVPDAPAPSVPYGRAESRARSLFTWCSRRGMALRDVAVIATHPVDRAAMLTCGMALALRDAGYDACAAADAVFPSRAEGGLAQALAYLARIRVLPGQSELRASGCPRYRDGRC